MAYFNAILCLFDFILCCLIAKNIITSTGHWTDDGNKFYKIIDLAFTVTSFIFIANVLRGIY